MVKNPLASAEDTGDTGSIPGSGGHGNPLSILAGSIPQMEASGGLLSIGSQNVENN